MIRKWIVCVRMVRDKVGEALYFSDCNMHISSHFNISHAFMPCNLHGKLESYDSWHLRFDEIL